MPYTIPENWVWAPFGHITISLDGGRIPVSKEERSRRPKLYDYYGASGVIDKIDNYLFDKPLLLIGEDGANLINRSTPIAFIARGKYWVNNHAHVLDGFSEDFLRCVELFVNAIDLKPYVTGTAQPKMNQAKMNSIPVALPPLAEQRRIVTKVDELMALCDRLETARKERETTRDRLTAASLALLNAPDPDPAVFQNHAAFALNNLTSLTTRPDQIKALRQTILNLAVRGKLVEQDPEDEPAGESLEKIEANRRARSRSKRGRPPIAPTESQKEEMPYTIPENWVWAPFGHITISLDGERIPVSKEERSRCPKLYDYYGASGVIDKIDNYLFDKPLLLIGEDGANLINRSTPIAFIARGKYWVNNHAHVLDGFSEDFLRCVELFVNAIDLKPYVTGTAQPKMNQAKMNSIPVALPPLAEQRRIVAKVDELMAVCDRLEASLAVGEETRGRLVEAVLWGGVGVR